MQPLPRSPWLTSAACALTLLAALQSSAANLWDGGGVDGRWSTPANWDDDLVPAFPVGLSFGGATGLAATNDLADLVVNGLSFAHDAGAFTIGGAGIGLGGNIENLGANLQTLTLPLALTAGRTVNTAFGDIAISGPVTSATNLDFIKIGAHTLTLSGPHAYTGRTGVGNFPNGTGMTPGTHQGGGTLVLDFSAPASPVSNLLYNGITPVAAQELRLSSGTVILQGKAAAENSQTIGQLGIATGFNTVSLQPGAGGKIVLHAGPITLAAGAGQDNNKSSLLNFALPPGTQDATHGVTTSSLNTNGILTPISGNIANLVVDGASWATNATNAAGGNIVPLADSAYTPSTATTTGTNVQNVDMVTDVTAANPTAWTLRFNNTGATGPRTLTNTNGGATMAINGGGILVTPGMGANDVTITGGNIRGSSNRGLFISNYNTGGGRLIINANVVNNSNGNTLTLGGGGVVRLNGANTYTNGTYVLRDTTLVVSSDTNLGFGSGSVTVAAASTSSPTVTLAAAGPGNGSFVVGASLLGSTIATIAGTTITLAGNANADIAADTGVSYAAAPALSLDGGTFLADGTFELRRTRPVDASGVGGDAVSDRRIGLGALGGTIEVSAENTLTVPGVVSSQATSGFGALTKTGPGTLVLGGANTYAGGTTIRAGTLRAGANAALGASGSTLTFAPASGAIFQLNGKSVTVGGLSADSTAIIENSGPAHGTLVVNSPRAIAFPGTLQNGSDHLLQLTKQGAGSLTLSGANTHGGDTLLGSGTLILAHSLALQSSSLNQQIGTGGGLVFDASVASRAFTLGGLKNNGSPTIALQNNAPSPEPVALSLGANHFNSSYGGVFTGAGSLTKIGTGKITLTGLNSYAGDTTVSAGTLALSGAGLLGAGSVAVGSAGTLDLSALDAATYAFSAGLAGGGLIEAAAKTVQITGALTPVGRLRITGDVALAATADGTFGVSAAATHDSVAVSGHLALDGEFAVVTTGGFAFAAGQSFDLYDSATTATGLDVVTVNGLALVHASGTWTASASGLSYTFTESTGLLEITGGSTATALETWRSDRFGSSANSGPGADLADPDGDGVPNLLEYATGTDPLVATGPAAAAGVADGRLTLTYTRVADPALTYTVQATTDLAAGPWTPLAVTGNPSTGPANTAGPVTITDTATLAAQPRRFLRLTVTY